MQHCWVSFTMKSLYSEQHCCYYSSPSPAVWEMGKERHQLILSNVSVLAHSMGSYKKSTHTHITTVNIVIPKHCQLRQDSTRSQPDYTLMCSPADAQYSPTQWSMSWEMGNVSIPPWSPRNGGLQRMINHSLPLVSSNGYGITLMIKGALQVVNTKV